ncbi:unnamed protein product, partial [Ilex paraguariensis]
IKRKAAVGTGIALEKSAEHPPVPPRKEMLVTINYYGMLLPCTLLHANGIYEKKNYRTLSIKEPKEGPKPCHQ